MLFRSEGEMPKSVADNVDVDKYKTIKCPLCKGRGVKDEEDCPGCGGEGEIARWRADEIS